MTDVQSFFDNLSNEEFAEITDILLENIGSIMPSDDKVFTDYELDFFTGLKNHYRNKFIAVEFIDQKLVLVDPSLNIKFLVSGLTEPLSDKITNINLPRIIETTLISLKDKIVYNIFMNQSIEPVN